MKRVDEECGNEQCTEQVEVGAQRRRRARAGHELLVVGRVCQQRQTRAIRVDGHAILTARRLHALCTAGEARRIIGDVQPGAAHRLEVVTARAGGVAR